MRVATLNILHSTESLEERVAHLIDILADERLDFLCLQEVLLPEFAGFDIVQRVADGLGLSHTDFYALDARKSGVAVLSRYALERAVQEPLTWGQPLLAVRATVSNRSVYVMNLHASWGRNNENRLRESLYADKLARQFYGSPADKSERPVVILAGDMNAVPDAENIRFLTGLDSQDGTSTLWVDAWEAADSGEEGWTTGDPTYLAQATASNMPLGVYVPSAMPCRRIDYIFLYEWVWGQAGYPLSTRRFASEIFLDSRGRKLTVSDHYGVLTELFMPDEE